MTETVAANGQTICHKNASGLVRSTVPDVCKAPTYPAPFTNVAFAKDLAKGTKSVKSHSGAMCGIKGSEFSTSIGDEGGVGKGVKSGTQLDKATWLSWSPNVFAEGKPMTRLSDRMLMNNGNTISAGGYYTGPVTGAVGEDLEKLCEYACDCMTAIFRQNCVAERIKEDFYDGAYPENFNDAMCAEVSMVHNAAEGVWGIILNNVGTGPTSNPITPRGGIRPDVVCREGGTNRSMIEMKFPNDELSQRQRDLYPQAAEDLGAEYQVLDVEDDCDCSGGGGGTAPEPVTAPRTSPDPRFTTPSEQTPTLFPWQDPRPAGDWCRPVPWTGGIIWECIRG